LQFCEPLLLVPREFILPSNRLALVPAEPWPRVSHINPHTGYEGPRGSQDPWDPGRPL
jgi:hypothetical protein